MSLSKRNTANMTFNQLKSEFESLSSVTHNTLGMERVNELFTEATNRRMKYRLSHTCQGNSFYVDYCDLTQTMRDFIETKEVEWNIARVAALGKLASGTITFDNSCAMICLDGKLAFDVSAYRYSDSFDAQDNEVVGRLIVRLLNDHFTKLNAGEIA